MKEGLYRAPPPCTHRLRGRRHFLLRARPHPHVLIGLDTQTHPPSRKVRLGPAPKAHWPWATSGGGMRRSGW